MSQRVMAAFFLAFDSVISQWGATKFHSKTLEHMNLRTSDLSAIELHQVAGLILDNCQHLPTVAKVIEYANLVRARRDRKYTVDRTTYQTKCDFCFDIGVIKAIDSVSSIQTLMLCDCFVEFHGNVNLPVWTVGCGFKKEPLNMHWFKPTSLSEGNEGRMIMAITQKSQVWSAKLKEAEQFWIYNNNVQKGDRHG